MALIRITSGAVAASRIRRIEEEAERKRAQIEKNNLGYIAVLPNGLTINPNPKNDEVEWVRKAYEAGSGTKSEDFLNKVIHELLDDQKDQIRKRITERKINRAGVPFSHVKELAEKTQIIIDVNNDFRKIEPFLLIHKERYLQINAIPNKANKDQAFIEFLKQITELNGIKIKYFFKVLRKLKNYYEEN